MPRYIFQFAYSSSYGAGQPGDVIDITEAEAATFNRDSPGVLAPEPEPEPDTTEEIDEPADDSADDDGDEHDDADPEQRALDAPPNHRQVTGGTKRGTKRSTTA